jgi:hypothetical protein
MPRLQLPPSNLQKIWDHVAVSPDHRDGRISCPLCGRFFSPDEEGNKKFWEHCDDEHPWNGVDRKLLCRVLGCKETFPSELYREIYIAGDPKHKVICPLPRPGQPPIRHPTLSFLKWSFELLQFKMITMIAAVIKVLHGIIVLHHRQKPLPSVLSGIYKHKLLSEITDRVAHPQGEKEQVRDR